MRGWTIVSCERERVGGGILRRRMAQTVGFLVLFMSRKRRWGSGMPETEVATILRIRFRREGPGWLVI